jgi:hypothetical protein
MRAEDHAGPPASSPDPEGIDILDVFVIRTGMIRDDWSFDTIEDEVLFTIASLAADPDAQDLVSLADGWIARLDEARAKDRGARQEVAGVDAMRAVANGRLDRACAEFGDTLLRAVDKDATSARYRQFFPMRVSLFVRRALPKQVAQVRAWLGSNDEALEPHREALDRWSKAAADALDRTHALAMVRGQARITREQLASDLTRERDGLHDALSARSRERSLARDWPDLFFRVERRARSAAEGAGDAVGEASSPPAE